MPGFANRRLKPLNVDERLCKGIMMWFAQVVYGWKDETVMEAALKTEFELGLNAPASLPIIAKLLARITGQIRTGYEIRKDIRLKLDPQRALESPKKWETRAAFPGRFYYSAGWLRLTVIWMKLDSTIMIASKFIKRWKTGTEFPRRFTNSASWLRPMAIWTKPDGFTMIALKYFEKWELRAALLFLQAQQSLLEEKEGNFDKALELIRKAESTFLELGSPMAARAQANRRGLENNVKKSNDKK